VVVDDVVELDEVLDVLVVVLEVEVEVDGVVDVEVDGVVDVEVDGVVDVEVVVGVVVGDELEVLLVLVVVEGVEDVLVEEVLVLVLVLVLGVELVVVEVVDIFVLKLAKQPEFESVVNQLESAA
jgi:hypothetical protein